MEILTLGEKIKQKRKEQNMTLKDLAGDRVTPGQISLVESGKSKPSIDLLEYIAEKMNVSLDYILETEEHQAEKLCEYYSKIAGASLYAGNYQQAREAISKGIIYAKDYNLEYFIGLNELYAGKIEYEQKDYKGCQNRFIASIEIFIRTRKLRDSIEAYLYLGLSAYKLSYFDTALNYFKQSEKLINEHGIKDDEILMKIYYNISLCYSSLGNYSATIDYVLLSMEKLKKKSDRLQYGQSLLMLSMSYNNMDKYDEALTYANKAMQVFKELDDLKFLAAIETNIGVILSDIGNLEDSFRHLENAYKIKQEIKDSSVILTMIKLADNYLKVKNTEKAMEVINEAHEACMEEGQDEYYIQVISCLHKIFMLREDKINAELCLLEGIKHLQSLNMPRDLALIYDLLAQYHEGQGNEKEALKYLNRSMEIYKELGDIPGIIYGVNKIQ